MMLPKGWLFRLLRAAWESPLFVHAHWRGLALKLPLRHPFLVVLGVGFSTPSLNDDDALDLLKCESQLDADSSQLENHSCARITGDMQGSISSWNSSPSRARSISWSLRYQAKKQAAKKISKRLLQ